MNVYLGIKSIKHASVLGFLSKVEADLKHKDCSAHIGSQQRCVPVGSDFNTALHKDIF